MSLAMSYLRLPPSLEGELDPGRIARLVFGVEDWRRRHPATRLFDVGGAWQGLHYLLTGDAWDGRPPEADAVCGGRLLTEDGAAELGMDVIYLSPDRVKSAAEHLANTPFGQIAGRYDLARMAAADVQDAGQWARRPPQEARDRLLWPAYEGLTRFFIAAAGEGQAIYKVMS
ncbi:YfbM family protein [Actinomadura alba]|uniref:YfbM family protein n=1 Tax=Actinomadura alba TaxID=406431 RepID=A0ABR7LLI0_9ACTN|nr:YfbM family protein [Actinomadura alba]MBC6465342.1 YfbM family protein [Actinomadura alba]